MRIRQHSGVRAKRNEPVRLSVVVERCCDQLATKLLRRDVDQLESDFDLCSWMISQWPRIFR